MEAITMAKFHLFATKIQKAALNNNLSKLREAVQRDPNIDEQETENGNTALMLAAMNGYDACVRELLQRGANANLRNKIGRTALMMAVCGNHVDTVRDLLRVSPEAQLPIKDKAGRTAQDYCLPKFTAISTLLNSCGSPSHTTAPVRMLATPTSNCTPPVPGASIAAPAQQTPKPASLAYPVVHTSPFHSAYPPNPEAAYNFVLRPPPPPAPASNGSQQPPSCTAQSSHSSQPNLDLLGPSVVQSPTYQPYPAITPSPVVLPVSPLAIPEHPAAVELQCQIPHLSGSGTATQQPHQLSTQQNQQHCQQATADTACTQHILGRAYTRQELEQATDFLSPLNKIGGGGFGAVYKGVLDGIPVAIKVMDSSAQAMQGLKEFTKEMDILSRMHHPHIVLLIGACTDSSMCSLVYELAEGGSLDDHMFRSHKRSVLSWQDRVRITAEVAAALLFLHSSQPPIAHMDIKPANILLTKSMVAKLGDVGLARIMKRPVHLHPSMPAPSIAQASHLVGTLTYIDPEYMRTGQFSTKSDVYALGVVMLQLLTGQEQGPAIPLVEEARKGAHSDPASFTNVIDPNVRQSWPVAEALAFADLALQCLEFRRTDRPDLRSVILPTLLHLRNAASMYPTPRASTLDTPPILPMADFPGGQGRAVPAMFTCPITQEILRFPVVAADGHTYEHAAIEAWIQRSATSPLTNLALPHTKLTPNLNLRSAISDWLHQ